MHRKLHFSDDEFAKVIRAIPRYNWIYSKKLVNQAFDACTKSGFDRTYAALHEVFGLHASTRKALLTARANAGSSDDAVVRALSGLLISEWMQHPGIEAKFQLLTEARGRSSAQRQETETVRDCNTKSH